jgi:hypothetical protein
MLARTLRCAVALETPGGSALAEMTAEDKKTTRVIVTH